MMTQYGAWFFYRSASILFVFCFACAFTISCYFVVACLTCLLHTIVAKTATCFVYPSCCSDVCWGLCLLCMWCIEVHMTHTQCVSGHFKEYCQDIEDIIFLGIMKGTRPGLLPTKHSDAHLDQKYGTCHK